MTRKILAKGDAEKIHFSVFEEFYDGRAVYMELSGPVTFVATNHSVRVRIPLEVLEALKNGTGGPI